MSHATTRKSAPPIKSRAFGTWTQQAVETDQDADTGRELEKTDHQRPPPNIWKPSVKQTSTRNAPTICHSSAPNVNSVKRCPEAGKLVTYEIEFREAVGRAGAFRDAEHRVGADDPRDGHSRLKR